MNQLTQRARVIRLLCVALILFFIGGVQVFAQHRQDFKQIQNYFEGNTKYVTPQYSNTHTRGKDDYRTIDGTENNLENPEYGAANIPLLRIFSPEYAPSNFLNDVGGQNRKSPREISNIVASQTTDMPSLSDLSALVYTWGQFVDHDIDLTPEGEELAIIPLPPDEPLFTMPIFFHRSEKIPGTGVVNFREQPNIITSWMDGSMVYGSDEGRAAWLRTFQGGKLRTSTGDLLVYNTRTGELADPIEQSAPGMAGDGDGNIKTVKVFVAGDVRANEQNGLTAMHTLFMREHNRLCDIYIGQGYTDDEEIYQKARAMVGGFIQSITINEWLPILGINLDAYDGYKEDVQPDIANVFSTAAFRIGHTMVANEIFLLDDEGNDVGPGTIALQDAFFNPGNVAQYNIAPILFGLAHQTQQEIDHKVVDDLRNFLFISPNAAFGLDLASLNIQRGRDHGLPDYKTIRDHFLGTTLTQFEEITSDVAVQDALKSAFMNDIDEIDAWMGMLSEDHEPGFEVGPTIAAILKDQFSRLRDGDYYFFENDPNLTQAEKDEIRNVVLSDILNRNTEFHFKRHVFLNNPNNQPWTNLRADAQNVGLEAQLAAQEQSMMLYPNPSSGRFSLATDMIPSMIEVYNFSGALVYKKEYGENEKMEAAIDMGYVQPGVYVLHLYDVGGAMEEVRFLVE